MAQTSGVGWDGGRWEASTMGKAMHAAQDRKKTAGGLRLLRTVRPPPLAHTPASSSLTQCTKSGPRAFQNLV